MTSRSDGAIGAVRLAPDEAIAAEFARYTIATRCAARQVV